EDGNDIALDQEPGYSAGKQNSAQHEIIREWDHYSDLLSPAASSRLARTTAPIMAMRTSTEVTSKGRRKSRNSSRATLCGDPYSPPISPDSVPEFRNKIHAIRIEPTSIPGMPNRTATRLPPVLSSWPAFSSMMTKTKSTMTAPA